MSSNEKTAVSDLLLRIRGGDRKAREQLFALLGDENEFGSVIRAMARRMFPRHHRARRFAETRDIVQSALRTGLNHFSDFRGETDGELYGWFRMIIRTKVHRATRLKEPDATETPRERHDRPPLAVIVDEEFLEMLQTAVTKLPLHQRVVVELRLRGANASEIGDVLGLKPATVRKRESRAVEKLRALVA